MCAEHVIHSGEDSFADHKYFLWKQLRVPWICSLWCVWKSEKSLGTIKIRNEIGQAGYTTTLKVCLHLERPLVLGVAPRQKSIVLLNR